MRLYLQLADLLRQAERADFVVRDAGLLAGAAARPQASAFDTDAYPTVWLKAAALCQSIDNSQSLVDGKKRLAWSATKVFLAINGHRLRASADDGEAFMLKLVAGHADLPVIATWLQQHSSTASPPDLPDVEI